MCWLEAGSPVSTIPAYRIHGFASFTGTMVRRERRRSSAREIPSRSASRLAAEYSSSERLICVRTMITVYEQLLSSTSSRALRALTRFVVWGPAPKRGGVTAHRDENRQPAVGRSMTRGPPVIYAAHAMLANCLRSVILCVSIPLCAASPACNKSDEARTDRPPPPPTAASSARADLCAGGGGRGSDVTRAPFAPRTWARLSLAPHGGRNTPCHQGKACS